MQEGSRSNMFGIATAIIALAVLGVFGTQLFFSKDGAGLSMSIKSENNTATAVSARHVYENGIHTIAGTATLPNKCHQLFSHIIFESGERNVATIVFNTHILSAPCDGGEQRESFWLSFSAPENVAVRALWDGRDVPFEAKVVSSLNDLSR